MRFFRSQRVGKLVREQISEILMREIEFPAGALATVTDVLIDKKLDYARVKVSVLPSEKSAGVLAALEANAGHLQHLLMKKINIKPMPRIAFEIDYGYENAAEVEKQLLEEEKRLPPGERE